MLQGYCYRGCRQEIDLVPYFLSNPDRTGNCPTYLCSNAVFGEGFWLQTARHLYGFPFHGDEFAIRCIYVGDFGRRVIVLLLGVLWLSRVRSKSVWGEAVSSTVEPLTSRGPYY